MLSLSMTLPRGHKNLSERKRRRMYVEEEETTHPGLFQEKEQRDCPEDDRENLEEGDQKSLLRFKQLEDRPFL